MKSPALLTASLLALIFSPSQTAKASDIGLDFSLPAPPNRPTNATQTKASTQPAHPTTAPQTLQIPAKAAHPPVSSSTLPPPPTVYSRRSLSDRADSITRAVTAALPPPPAIPTTPAVTPVKQSRGRIALHFNLDTPPLTHTSTSATEETDHTAQTNDPISNPDIFQGGVNSLVAKAIGSAEGTRTPAGHRTSAYYGHIDPGNQAWNLGTFSYQHGAPTPEDADERQLQRLQAQTQVLDQKANIHGLRLTIEEKLNGLDLANQAPSAALGRGGYLEWLSQAHRMGMAGSEAILWSRTRSFLDPDTQRWNAPGLGNTVASISRDQERRMRAIGRAIDIHHPQPASPQPAPILATNPKMASPQTQSNVSPSIVRTPPQPKAKAETEAADIIFSVSLPPSAMTAKANPSASSHPPALANQSPILPESSPASSLEASPAEALPDLPQEDSAQQARVKHNPAAFTSFPPLATPFPPTSEPERPPSSIAQLDAKMDSLLVAQSEQTNPESVDPFLFQDN